MIGSATLAHAWFRRSGGERAVIAIVALIVIGVVAVFALVLPLMGAVQRARTDLARTQVLLAAARAHRATEDALAHAALAIAGEPSATAVARVLAQYALAPLGPPRATADGSIDVIVAAAPFEALVRAFDTLARTENLRVERAALTALADAGNVRAEFTLRPGVPR